MEISSDRYILNLLIRRAGMFEKFLAYLRDEDGQTSTEYILLVAVVAMIVFRFKTIAQSKLESLTNKVFSEAENSINFSSN